MAQRKAPARAIGAAEGGGDASILPAGTGFGPAAATRFLRALGKDPAFTRLRCIKPNRGGAEEHQGVDSEADLIWLNNKITAGFNVYAVIGNATGATGKGGGVTDADITGVPALFVEWDDGASIEEQIQRWQSLGLPEPTVMVATGGKSLHCYWRLDEPMAPQPWRALQKRLIAHCKSDSTCSNPSRVMRLAGSVYFDKKTGEPTGKCEIIANSGACYTAAEIEAHLPAPAPAKPVAAGPSRQFEPRSIDEVNTAATFVPRRHGGEGTYDSDRNALCGCSAALAEAGHSDPDNGALALLSYLWPDEKAAQQVLESTTTRNAASFWAIAREHGYDLRGTGRGLSVSESSALTTVEPNTPAGTSEGKSTTLKAGRIVKELPHRVGGLRLNTRTQEIHSGDQVISGNALSRLYLRLSSPAVTWPKEATYDAAIQLAQQNSFDPIAEYLSKNNAVPLPIEHWRRLDQCLLGIDDPVAAAFLLRYLIAAVARTHEPACDFRQVPVLVGPQWIGKTALGRILFGGDYFISGVGDLKKDALMRCHTAWGVELAELDGITRKADQEELKQFVSETSDVFRMPYDKTMERWPRRFLFWGTSNGAALRDITGSSRYVCIAVEKMLPLAWVQENRDAIWRRAVLQYEAGENWRECDQESREAINERNDNFSEEDPWLQPVANYLERKRTMGDLPVHIPDILGELEVTTNWQNNKLSSRVQRLAVSMGWATDRRSFRGKRVKGLWPPATPATPLITAATPPATPPDSAQGNGSDRAAIPATPITEKEGGKVRAAGGGGTNGGCEGTFHPCGVAGVAEPSKALHCKQSEAFGWYGSGVAGPLAGVAAVGSGADAFSEGDDPAWGPRPQ